MEPATLFDRGNSLFNFAWADDWSSDKNLESYVETVHSGVYDDFIGTAKQRTVLLLSKSMQIGWKNGR